MTDATTVERKLFVLDTNVLLHDHEAMYKFEEHDVVIPIVVLEEVDQFKRGNDHIHFQAREFIRELDKLSGDALFAEGIPLGQLGGRLFVEIGDRHNSLVESAFELNKADHRILAVAEQLRRKRPDRQVIIVSKDINLRVKAKALGIPAEDFENDKIEVESLYHGVKRLDGFDSGLISRFYGEPFSVPVDEIPMSEPPVANQYYILRNGSSSALTCYNADRSCLERIYKRSAFGIEPRNAEQIFAMDALMRSDIQCLTITGKAGTGKTLLALAAALEQRREFRQIFLARPVVPMGNRDLGYLPGDIKSKLDPYMQPLWDNLGVIKHVFPGDSKEQKQISDMVEHEKLYIAPLAFIRGRSLDSVFFIVDEAQNLTPHEIKTIITRAGQGAKVIFTGDIYQIDTPYLDTRSNGLAHLVHRMKGQKLYAHVNLVKGERSQLSELASNLL